MLAFQLFKGKTSTQHKKENTPMKHTHITTILTTTALTLTACTTPTEPPTTITIGNETINLTEHNPDTTIYPETLTAHTTTITANTPPNTTITINNTPLTTPYTINNLGDNLTVALNHNNTTKNYTIATQPEGFPHLTFDTPDTTQTQTIMNNTHYLTDFYSDSAINAQAAGANPQIPLKKNTIARFNHAGDLLAYKQSDNIILNFDTHTTSTGQKRYTYFQETPEAGSKTGYYRGHYVIADEHLNPINTITPKPTDLYMDPHPAAESHDFLVLGDNHYMLIDYYFNKTTRNQRTGEPIPEASAYIQEIKDDTVVWEWLSSEHDDIQQLITTYENIGLLAPISPEYYDPVHINSIDINPLNGNVVFSSRSLDAIIEINRTTGNIEWVFGGENNQFTVTSENGKYNDGTPAIAKQHDAKLTTTETGKLQLTLYNNSEPGHQASRGMTYNLNTEEKTAELVSEVDDANQQAVYTGSYTTLDNGSLVGWGMNKKHPILATLFDNNGNPVQRVTYDGSYNLNTYRWNLDPQQAS